MECLNCKRIIVKNLGKNKILNMPKTCPWCSKPTAPRQSKRKVFRSKGGNR